VYEIAANKFELFYLSTGPALLDRWQRFRLSSLETWNTATDLAMLGSPKKRERKAFEEKQLITDESTRPLPPKRRKLTTEPSDIANNYISPPLEERCCPPSKPNQSTKYHLPGFWDAISSISLTRRALQEFDRRNSIYIPQATEPTEVDEVEFVVGDIKRFARLGGPDLSDIQGYPEPSACSEVTMRSSRPGTNRVSKPSGTNPNTESSKTKKSGKSSAYDNNFQRLLTERYVDPLLRANRPANLEQLKSRMNAPRISLSPSSFTDEDHESFLDELERSKGEPEVMRDIFIKIRGPARYPSATDRPCGNWAPLLSQLSKEADLVTAQPDYCEGNAQDARSMHIRRDLDTYIVPSLHSDVLFLPNFFVEVKGEEGSLAVARRQTCYDGALGARGIHHLQNHSLPIAFDNNAYTFTSVFQSGRLDIYAHHITQPEGPGLEPHYHMTSILTRSLDAMVESFREGVTAFRNAQDMAHEYREHFIQGANRRLGATVPNPPKLKDKA